MRPTRPHAPDPTPMMVSLALTWLSTAAYAAARLAASTPCSPLSCSGARLLAEEAILRASWLQGLCKVRMAATMHATAPTTDPSLSPFLIPSHNARHHTNTRYQVTHFPYQGPSKAESRGKYKSNVARARWSAATAGHKGQLKPEPGEVYRKASMAALSSIPHPSPHT